MSDSQYLPRLLDGTLRLRLLIDIIVRPAGCKAGREAGIDTLQTERRDPPFDSS